MKRPDAPISASEAELYYSCKRKWAAKYGGENDWPREDKEASQFQVGHGFHKLAEVYAEHGFVPRDPHPVIDMFLHAMKYLPVPKSH